MLYHVGYEISSSAIETEKEKDKEKKRILKIKKEREKNIKTFEDSEFNSGVCGDGQVFSLLVFDPLSDGCIIKRNLESGRAGWKSQLKRGIS